MVDSIQTFFNGGGRINLLIIQHKIVKNQGWKYYIF